MSLTDIKSIHYYPVIKVKVIKVIKIFGRKYFPYSIYINNIYIYYSSK